MSEKFIYPIVVTIGDTNLEGNVYWATYCEWFGKAREMFTISILPNFLAMMSSGLRAITRETNLKHSGPAYFMDRIDIEIGVKKITPASLEIVGAFIKKDPDGKREKLAEAWQTIVFADSSGKLIAVPPEIKQAVQPYLAEPTLVGVK